MWLLILSYINNKYGFLILFARECWFVSLQHCKQSRRQMISISQLNGFDRLYIAYCNMNALSCTVATAAGIENICQRCKLHYIYNVIERKINILCRGYCCRCRYIVDMHIFISMHKWFMFKGKHVWHRSWAAESWYFHLQKRSLPKKKKK